MENTFTAVPNEEKC